MNLRLFCAISVPADVQSELVSTSQALARKLPPSSVSWVKSGNFHITLSFLGDVDESRVPLLTAQLHQACDEVTSFDLVCEGLSCFPNLNRPRVLWAGVQGEGARLPLLQQRVATACSPFTQREEKSRFHGHVTLGRVKPGAVVPKKVLEQEFERSRSVVFGSWPVTEVQLIRSELLSRGPRYSIAHTFPLLR
jgi:2'-5' RNA ligase